MINPVKSFLTHGPLINSGAPWVRKFGYLCIQEMLVLNKIVRTYVRPPLEVSRGEIRI